MDPSFERLIAALRVRGLRVSPAERIEAARAVSAVGIESRPVFQSALRATLAKDRESVAIFDEVFDALFQIPRGRKEGKGERGEGDGDGGRGGAGSGRGKVARIQRDREPQRRSGRASPRAGDVRQRPSSSERSAPAGRPPRIVRAPASRRRHAGPSEPAERTKAGPAGRDLRHAPLIAALSTEEEAALARAIPAIVQEIRLRKGRRVRGGPRGRLWVKRMLRRTAAHGGIPFVLPMKERRPRTTKVLLLVDVSHSVARAAALFLLIAQGLSSRAFRTSVFFFVDRAVEVTDRLRAWTTASSVPIAAAPPARAPRGRRVAGRRGFPGARIAARPGGPSFQDLLLSLPDLNLAAPSDYGAVFYQMRSSRWPVTGRDVVLVVLGDARTNRRDPLVWAFEDLAGRCRRTIWINPEPLPHWDTEDSVMGEYASACDVLCEAGDLEGLAAGVREILRSL